MIAASLLLGFFCVLGFLFGTFLVWRQARQLGLSEEKIIDLCIVCVFLGLVGGRIIYVAENWSQFQVNLLRLVLFLKYPGFSVFGGALFFVASLSALSRLSKLKVAEVLDIFSLPILVSVLIVLLPCFATSCVAVESGRILPTLFGLAVCSFGLQKIKDALFNDSKFSRVKHKRGMIFCLTGVVLLVSGLVIAKKLPVSLYFVERITVFGLVIFIGFWYAEIIRMIKLPSSVLGQIRQYLEDKLRDTEHRLTQLRHEDPTSDKDRLHQESSDDDTATDKAKHERVEALQGQLNKSVIEMRKALTKIKVGSYGNCESCGKLIDTDRLAAMPQATLCMDCEKKKEKGKK